MRPGARDLARIITTWPAFDAAWRVRAAALERIAHRMLVQRGWDDDRALAAAAG